MAYIYIYILVGQEQIAIDANELVKEPNKSLFSSCQMICKNLNPELTFSYGPLPVISTYNLIYRIYNPIEITSYN